jgi:hypothetical protein
VWVVQMCVGVCVRWWSQEGEKRKTAKRRFFLWQSQCMLHYSLFARGNRSASLLVVSVRFSSFPRTLSEQQQQSLATMSATRSIPMRGSGHSGVHSMARVGSVGEVGRSISSEVLQLMRLSPNAKKFNKGRPPWYDSRGSIRKPVVVGVAGGSGSGKKRWVLRSCPRIEVVCTSSVG